MDQNATGPADVPPGLRSVPGATSTVAIPIDTTRGEVILSFRREQKRCAQCASHCKSERIWRFHEVSINGGTPKWMVYNETSYQNG